MKGGLFLDIVVSQSAPVLKLFARKNEPLLIRGNAFLVLNLGLDVVDGVRRLDFEGDRFAREPI